MGKCHSSFSKHKVEEINKFTRRKSGTEIAENIKNSDSINIKTEIDKR